MFYWVAKYVLIGPLLRLFFPTKITGAANVPEQGGAILVSNHVAVADSFFLPLHIKRRVTFLAKAEYFTEKGIKGWFKKQFFLAMGQVPVDRTGANAAQDALDTGVRLLKKGDLLGIYPEGTRSPDGRLYKGKTGVARLVLQAGVPVVPVAMIDTELVPSRFFKIPTMRRPKIRIGKPMDFSAYAAAGNDRDVLRWITNEIMNAVMELSGQEYVDVYGTVAKTALEEGKQLPASAGHRPGAGRAVPPIPIRPAALDVPPVSDVNV